MKKTDVLNLKKKLQDEFLKKSEAIDLVLQMLSENEGSATSPQQNPQSQHPSEHAATKRTRGLLNAVRDVLPAVPSEFTRFDVLAALTKDYPEIAEKMRPESLRGSLATLQAEGLITVIRESAGTRPALYSQVKSETPEANASVQVA